MESKFYLLRQVCPIQTLPDKVLLRILGFIPHKVEAKHLYINRNVHNDIERKNKSCVSQFLVSTCTRVCKRWKTSAADGERVTIKNLSFIGE